MFLLGRRSEGIRGFISLDGGLGAVDELGSTGVY